MKLPIDISDDDAILLSDVFPTGYFGADLAHIRQGHTVAVFGCGPVGQFAIVGARLMGAGRIFAIDAIPDRLARARAQGAEIIDFEREDPVAVIRNLTGGIGVDRAIDAVGIDANAPARADEGQRREFAAEVERVAPHAHPVDGNWHPGDAPSQVHSWAVECLAKAGTLAIVGVYPQTYRAFPIGAAFMKNLTIRGGNCNHRKYIPELIRLVQSGVVEPSEILTQVESFGSAIDAHKAFDERQPGWMKVELLP